MKKTKIFIDFDGTLHDTAKLKEATFSAFEKFGFSRDIILAAYVAECADAKFTSAGFVERICAKRNDLIDRFEIIYDKIVSDSDDRVYPDVIPFLINLDRTKYEINLITLGDLSFQEKKVMASGIDKHFDNTYYTSDTPKWQYLTDLVLSEERFLFVDDRSDTVAEIAKHYPKAVALEINRSDEDKDDPARNRGDYTNTCISNIGELNNYLD